MESSSARNLERSKLSCSSLILVSEPPSGIERTTAWLPLQSRRASTASDRNQNSDRRKEICQLLAGVVMTGFGIEGHRMPEIDNDRRPLTPAGCRRNRDVFNGIIQGLQHFGQDARDDDSFGAFFHSCRTGVTNECHRRSLWWFWEKVQSRFRSRRIFRKFRFLCLLEFSPKSGSPGRGR